MSGIRREKTAIARVGLSRPIRLAMEAGLFDDSTRILDYGCGRGDDVRRLTEAGFQCTGWDPAHRNDAPPDMADVVNLGYVVNVIEDPEERRGALQRAWSLARRLLIVSARLEYEVDSGSFTAHRDGFLTARRTFQKFFSQSELRLWIEAALSAPAVAVAPGVFLVFRQEADRFSFQASSFRRPVRQSAQALSKELFEEHQELLGVLMEFFRARGRLPEQAEVPETADLIRAFGSLRRAFLVIRRVTGVAEWDQICRERAEDFLVYLALQRFDGRPRYSALPRELQLDVKALLSSYRQACDDADKLLFSAGDMSLVNQACRSANVGKLTRDALYVHETALPSLPGVLRVYEGCARAYLGQVDGANILKLNRIEPKISYLSYPSFDRTAHPELLGSLTVGLRTLSVTYRNFGASENPPILHRKETFVDEDYPGREKFAGLTRMEERKGLLEDSRQIGWKRNWEERLRKNGIATRGHRLKRRSPST